jgi:hypothetical protein
MVGICNLWMFMKIRLDKVATPSTATTHAVETAPKQPSSDSNAHTLRKSSSAV